MVALKWLSLTFVLAASFSGKGPVLRAERDIEGFIAQQAMVFNKDGVLLSSNSNFLCEPEPVGQIGVFRASYSATMRSDRAEAEQLAVRVTPGNPPDSPHDLRLYIGEKEIGRDPALRVATERLILRQCLGVSAKPERAARVELVPAREPDSIRVTELGAKVKSKIRKLPLAKACKAQSEGRWACRIDGYGLVFLRAESR